MKLRKILFLMLFVGVAFTFTACGPKEEEVTVKPLERKYHMFNLATTFATAFDPYWDNHSDFYNQWMNSNQIRDDFIDYLVVKMRELDPDQREEYLEYWEEYEIYENKMMHNIPLYSNQKYEFFNESVYSVDTEGETLVDEDGNNAYYSSSFWSWPEYIQRLRIGTTDSTNPRATNTARTELDTRLVLGSHDFSGNFFPGFGNSAYDANIRDVVFGYSTVTFNEKGEFLIDETVVSDYTITGEDENVYTFTLNENLKDHEGNVMTARDFVFAMYLQAASAMTEAGSSDTSYTEIVGYEDYHEGTTDEFTGVEWISEFEFSVTINPDELPYFYKLALVAVNPLPADVYFEDFDETDPASTPITDEMAVSIVETYTSAPVAAGPYYFYAMAEDYTSVTLKRNEFYAGDFEGIKSEIDTIVIVAIPQLTDMDHLINGTIDVLCDQIEGEKIDAALAEDYINFATQLRNGYGLIAFHVDMPIVDDYRVRQAITYLIDRQAFVDQFLGGYGLVVDGPYGLSQWMVEESDIVPEELINYTKDIDKAIELLESAGWMYGKADGETLFDKDAGHDTRYNRLGVPLVINWGAQEDSRYSNLLLPIMMDGFEEAGVQLEVDYLNWDGLLSNYYYVVNEMEARPEE